MKSNRQMCANMNAKMVVKIQNLRILDYNQRSLPGVATSQSPSFASSSFLSFFLSFFLSCFHLFGFLNKVSSSSIAIPPVLVLVHCQSCIEEKNNSLKMRLNFNQPPFLPSLPPSFPPCVPLSLARSLVAFVLYQPQLVFPFIGTFFFLFKISSPIDSHSDNRCIPFTLVELFYTIAQCTSNCCVEVEREGSVRFGSVEQVSE